jgi:transcriptional regulator with XRE-family HTH domain
MQSVIVSKEMATLVKSARVGAGLTQMELAKKLGYKSPQFISNWERGESSPPPAVISKIARATKTRYSDYKTILLADFERQLDNKNFATLRATKEA